MTDGPVLESAIERELAVGAPDEAPSPGRMAIVMAALAIGFVLMGIQIWLLTVALDLYLGGEGGQVWQLAVASGAIFAGGLAMLLLLNRRPRTRVGGSQRGEP